LKHRSRSELLKIIVEISCQALSTSDTVSDQEATDGILSLSTFDTISQSFENIYNDLNGSKSGLRVCLISAGPFNGKSPYSTGYRLRHSQEDREDYDCFRIFRAVILSLLLDTWAADWEEREMMKSLILQPFSKLRSLHMLNTIASSYTPYIQRT
jgi:hypothetical protein